MTDTARRILIGILVIGLAGLSTELLLLEHHEDLYQLIPLVLAGAAAVSLAVLVVAPDSRTVRLFQVVMALFVVGGVVGAWLHFQANVEFQLEMDASLTGMALFQKAIRAKAPPALAPGAMIQLGLIGLACTYRHPALGGSVRLKPDQGGSMARFLALTLVFFLAAPAAAQVGKSLGVVDANTVAEADLVKMPGMTPAVAKALVAARPFDSIVALNTFLLGQKLTQEQANEFYKHAFIHINLNTATGEEILLVPGAGKRMAREFAEYRPWKSYAQFDKEIGKYVDAKEVARLAQYTFIPVNLNTATDEDILSIPGAGRRMVREFKEYRPWKTQAQFEKEIGKYVDAKEVKRLWRYVVIS